MHWWRWTRLSSSFWHFLAFSCSYPQEQTGVQQDVGLNLSAFASLPSLFSFAYVRLYITNSPHLLPTSLSNYSIVPFLLFWSPVLHFVKPSLPLVLLHLPYSLLISPRPSSHTCSCITYISPQKFCVNCPLALTHTSTQRPIHMKEQWTRNTKNMTNRPRYTAQHTQTHKSWGMPYGPG